MANYEIGVIAPDGELFTLITQLASDLCEPILVKMGFLDEGVYIAQDMLNQGIKVLVCRGGTTAKLRDSNIPLPIIDIPITEYDVIRLLDQARAISSKIAVIGFDSLIRGAEAIAPILKVEITTFLVQNKQEVKLKVQEAKERGIPVVVGAKLAVEFAEKISLKGILIKSQKSAVIEAIKEASKVLNAIKKEGELGERLKTLLDSVHDSIISVDKEGRITHLNNNAVKLMNLDNKNLAVGKLFSKLLNDSSVIKSIARGEKIAGEITSINGIAYVFDITPIYIDEVHLGAIIIFRELAELQSLEQKIRRKLYQKGHIAKYCFRDIIRHSNSPIEKIIKKANYYAGVDSTVLIQGESGTGKELLVQSLHNVSKRKNGPFIAVNCAVLPENLLESELFGYEEGAFTGAKKGGKPGLFELAHGGTLFLDEIGEISELVQARLLRVLEERQIMRIGDDKVIPIDVRIFCATNKNILNMVNKGRFREDLYYRINILRLELPPLRERREDIHLLVESFLNSFSSKLSKKKPLIEEKGMKILMTYQWFGNIRELKNVVERLVVTSKEIITYNDVIEIMDEGQFSRKLSDREDTSKKQSVVEQEELKLILKVLQETRGNKAEAARRLGLSKTTLWRRLKKFNY